MQVLLSGQPPELGIFRTDRGSLKHQESGTCGTQIKNIKHIDLSLTLPNTPWDIGIDRPSPRFSQPLQLIGQSVTLLGCFAPREALFIQQSRGP